MHYPYQNLRLYVLPLRSDNYSYIIHDSLYHKTLVVDPSETAPIVDFLRKHNFTLDMILDTHHHNDHTEGNLELQKIFGSTIFASHYDKEKDRIPGKSSGLEEGDFVNFTDYRFRVLETPGHTLGHICYVLDDAGWLFCGDTLFSLGCGRLFEGNAAIMWKTFLKLRDLPDETLVFCGHEYTLANARFAQAMAPGLPGLMEHIKGVELKFKNQKTTIPSRLGDEKSFNPFFLADHKNFKDLGPSPEEVFGEIRRRKDHF